MATPLTPRRAEIDSFYTCQHPDQFQIDWRTFYREAERSTDGVRARWAHELDVPYGAHRKQRLDLYYPGDRATAAPVLLFLHGGGFREGDPTLYGYLAEPYLRRGAMLASVGYRLTPECYLPETARDVEDALAWCYAHLRERGSDPDRMVLAGHSAGAILTAHVSLRRDWLDRRGLPADLIQGAVPISGMYDFSAGAEYIPDPAQRTAASPLLNIGHVPPYTLVAYGSHERTPKFGEDSQKLVEALRAKGGRADLLRLDGLDHADTVNAFADERSTLFQGVARMLAG